MIIVTKLFIAIEYDTLSGTTFCRSLFLMKY